MVHSGGRPHYLHPNGRIGPIGGMRLMELQAAGKLPGPVPASMMQKVLAAVRSHHRHPDFHRFAQKAKGVALWAVNTNNDYLIGQSKAQKTVSAINLGADNCDYPQSVHVDHSANVLVGCEYNGSFSYGQVVSLSSSGTFQAGYSPGCPAPLSLCNYWYSYSFDAASNGSDIFIAMPFTEEETCNPSCTYTYGSGFEWWPAGSPSASPTFINVGESCAPVCDTYYMDLDSSGNIWFSYYGCQTSCGGGLGEVTNPTTNPTFQSIIQPGTFECPGGVYISNSGNTLNYVDECQREIFQYAMPVSVSGLPSNTLGPTPQNAFYAGEPVTMGFNSTDTKVAVGDAAGWVDVGTVAKNQWKAIPSINFGSYVPGAAFTPSDK
jgi:hypothetical protein